MFIAAYFGAIAGYHLTFTDWLLASHPTPFGAIKPAAYLGQALTLTALAVVLYLAHRAWRGRRRLVSVGYWIGWVAAVLMIDRTLIFSLPEYLHFPQYAILAWLLAKALDPARKRFVVGRVLFWTTLLGAADELNQYLFLTTRYSHYFDVNDVLINLLAAVAGVLLYYGFQPLPARPGRGEPGEGQDAAALPTVCPTGAIVPSPLLQSLLPRRERVRETEHGGWAAERLPPGERTGARGQASGEIVPVQQDPRFASAIAQRRFRYFGARALPFSFPELATLTLVAVLAGVLSLTGHMRITPSGEVPPGGLRIEEGGRTTLYLQRHAKWYASWQPAAHNPRYWILDPLAGSLLVMAGGLLFGSFSLRLTGVPLSGKRMRIRQPLAPGPSRCAPVLGSPLSGGDRVGQRGG